MVTRTFFISLAALLLALAAPVFAADGDPVPYPDPGRPANYQIQIAADGDQFPTPPWQG